METEKELLYCDNCMGEFEIEHDGDHELRFCPFCGDTYGDEIEDGDLL